MKLHVVLMPPTKFQFNLYMVQEEMLDEKDIAAILISEGNLLAVLNLHVALIQQSFKII